MKSHWGFIPTNKLAEKHKILKFMKKTAAEEPICSSMFNTSNHEKMNDNYHRDDVTLKCFDHYVINTIELNSYIKLLKEDKTNIRLPNLIKDHDFKLNNDDKIIISNNEAIHLLKDFIILMCFHSGFNDICSLSLDILIDVLYFYIKWFLLSFKENKKFIDSCDLKKIKDYYDSFIINYFNKTQFKAINLSRTTNNNFDHKVNNTLNNQKVYEKKNNLNNDCVLNIEYLHNDTFDDIHDTNRISNNNNNNCNKINNKNNKIFDNYNNNISISQNDDLTTLSNELILNDECCLSFNESLLQEFDSVISDDDVDKLFQIIGCDPFSDELQ